MAYYQSVNGFQPVMAPLMPRPNVLPAAQPPAPAPVPGATRMPLPAPTAGPVQPAPAPYTPPAGFNDIRSQTLSYNPVGAGGISIGNVALPGTSNTAMTQSLLNQAKQGYNATPEQQRLRDMSMQQLQGLNTAPDRVQLAAQALQLQREMTQPQWLQDQRTVGQNAAAMGRIGAGMTTNELTGLTLAREKALGQYGEQAALEAAGQTMADRLAKFGATSGYQNQITGQDYGRASGLSGLVGQQFGIDTNKFNEGMGRAGLDLSVQRAQADAAAARAGLQSEQAARQLAAQQQQQQMQNQQAQQAIDNRVQQQLIQEQLLNGAFERQLRGATGAGALGYGGSPY